MAVRRHSSVVPASSGARVGALVLCVLWFGFLGGLMQFAVAHGARKEPRAIPEDLLPRELGEWRYAGSEEGWLSEGYPIARTLYRYERADGGAIRLTAAVGQERYGAFANLVPVLLQRSHEITSKLRADVRSPDGESVSLPVSIMGASTEEPSFAFAGLFWDGRRVTTSLAAVKAGVTLRRAVGAPRPTVAVYLARPIDESTDASAAASDVGAFASLFLPTVVELRDDYARSAQ